MCTGLEVQLYVSRLVFFVFLFKGGVVVVVVIVVGGVVVGGARKEQKSSKCSVGAAHGCLAAAR